MSTLINWIKNRGVHSGLNQTSNSVKMAGLIVGPFMVAWLAVRIILPEEFGDFGSLFVFIGWLCYCVLLFAKTKADASSLIPFPQSHWFFPDGQQVSYDILVPPNGWELIKKYDDGSCLYRVNIVDKIAYQDEDRPFPDVFNKMLWKLPDEWNNVFQRNGHGEFFFKNLFIDHPACENIEISVIEWRETSSTRLPICLVTGCSYYFMQAMKLQGRGFAAQIGLTHKQVRDAYISDLREQVRELQSRNQFLEDEAEQYTKKEPRSIKELSDKRISRIREEVGDIMDVEGGIKEWLMLNGKYVAYALLALGGIGLLAYLMGWI